MLLRRLAFSSSLAAALLALPLGTAVAQSSSGKNVQLFNGKSLDGFDTFLEESGLNHDPKRVFQVQDGVIRISGEDWGYFITKKEYENYRLRVEFKWGQETHAPRKDKARDSGILFHTVGPNKVWPKSIEFQMIEGGTGDVILVGNGTSLTRDGVTRIRGTRNGSRFNRYGKGPWKDVVGYRDPEHEVEKPHGQWNVLELIADGDSVEYRVNGQLVNKGTQADPSRGKILMQSEGAELFVRKIELTPLEK